MKHMSDCYDVLQEWANPSMFVSLLDWLDARRLDAVARIDRHADLYALPALGDCALRIGAGRAALQRDLLPLARSEAALAASLLIRAAGYAASPGDLARRDAIEDECAAHREYLRELLDGRI